MHLSCVRLISTPPIRLHLRAAFSDDAAADSAKKSLFMMQLRGVFEKGNSFSAFGQISVMKDLMKGLNR